jgi:hypothetical protein
MIHELSTIILSLAAFIMGAMLGTSTVLILAAAVIGVIDFFKWLFS